MLKCSSTNITLTVLVLFFLFISAFSAKRAVVDEYSKNRRWFSENSEKSVKISSSKLHETNPQPTPSSFSRSRRTYRDLSLVLKECRGKFRNATYHRGKKITVYQNWVKVHPSHPSLIAGGGGGSHQPPPIFLLTQRNAMEILITLSIRETKN